MRLTWGLVTDMSFPEKSRHPYSKMCNVCNVCNALSLRAPLHACSDIAAVCCDSRIVRWQEILSPSSLCTAVFDEIIPSRKRWDYLSFLLSRIFGDPKELCSNGERPPGTPKSSARMGRAESEVGSTAAELQFFSIFLMNAIALFRFIEIR